MWGGPIPVQLLLIGVRHTPPTLGMGISQAMHQDQLGKPALTQVPGESGGSWDQNLCLWSPAASQGIGSKLRDLPGIWGAMAACYVQESLENKNKVAQDISHAEKIPPLIDLSEGWVDNVLRNSPPGDHPCLPWAPRELSQQPWRHFPSSCVKQVRSMRVLSGAHNCQRCELGTHATICFLNCLSVKPV